MGVLSKTRFKQEGQESNSRSSADVLFRVFFVFCFGGMGGVARAQISIIWSYGREHLRRAWSTSVGERPATGFSLAAFALVCAMVGSRDLVFWHFIGRKWDALAACEIPRTRASTFIREDIVSGASGS